MANSATYGVTKYNESYYGQLETAADDPQNYFGGVPVGIRVRGQIGKEFIYRIRQGNGYSGSVVGRDYQDKYKYFVPSSINNPESDYVRAIFKDGVAAWQSLSAAAKEQYRSAATRRGGLTGHNLFMSNYIKGALNGC